MLLCLPLHTHIYLQHFIHLHMYNSVYELLWWKLSKFVGDNRVFFGDDINCLTLIFGKFWSINLEQLLTSQQLLKIVKFYIQNTRSLSQVSILIFIVKTFSLMKHIFWLSGQLNKLLNPYRSAYVSVERYRLIAPDKLGHLIWLHSIAFCVRTLNWWLTTVKKSCNWPAGNEPSAH